jgi:dipeptidyl aminopeptidase/acylaminoacyl peptidase
MRADSIAKEGWSSLMTVGPEDALSTQPAGFDKSGNVIYLIDSRDRDTAAFKSLDLKSGKLTEIFASDVADVDNVLTHPTEHHVQAVSFNFDRPKWEVLDESVRADFEYLQALDRGDLSIGGRTLDDKLWTVAYELDNGPVKFYLYDRAAKKGRFLFSHRPELETLPLAAMRSEVITSRDGLKLVSYLTLPNGSDPDNDGRPDKPLPMVLLVHGGPWARDSWGFDPLHQLFANRGYAVLAVNYRGSTGFGKKFVNAANMEWAGKMHDDLLDAVNWAVERGVAERDKVAIMGGSYGGYATLVGLTFTPEFFACGVDIVGPSSLTSLLQNPPPYWMPMMSLMKNRVGDWESEPGRAFLNSRSPLFKANEIRRPLLIGQGAKDPRVKQAESDQIVSALKARNIPVTYMLYPEEGHGFDRPENNLAFFAVTEVFLANHLGGQFEAIGNAFLGANFQVPAGANHIPGVAESLESQKAK